MIDVEANTIQAVAYYSYSKEATHKGASVLTKRVRQKRFLDNAFWTKMLQIRDLILMLAETFLSLLSPVKTRKNKAQRIIWKLKQGINIICKLISQWAPAQTFALLLRNWNLSFSSQEQEKAQKQMMLNTRYETHKAEICFIICSRSPKANGNECRALEVRRRDYFLCVCWSITLHIDPNPAQIDMGMHPAGASQKQT
jgi:hypothetical protein